MALMRFLSRFLVHFAVLVALMASISTTTRATDAGVTITRVFAGWRDAESFKRISEYFSGHENTGGAVVLRSHPEQRAGFYFLLRTSNPGAPIDVKIDLALITPTDTQPKHYSFNATLKSGATVLNLGLTAGDWPDAKANPVAWKIDFLDNAGQIVAQEQSYLWAKP
jgi:hypothetical protein